MTWASKDGFREFKRGMPKIAICLDQATYDAIWKAAHERGISFSEASRRLLKGCVDAGLSEALE